MYRQVGNHYESRYELPVDSGVNYMLPNFKHLFEFPTKIIDQMGAINWSEKHRMHVICIQTRYEINYDHQT